MNEIERAIRHFEDGSDAARKIKASEPETEPICDNIIHMNDIAISTLREQAEREKGCEWCTGALPEDITPHREFFKNMLKGWSEDWLCVAKKVPSGEHILHCETDTALTDFSVDIPIRFCPMCGRRLEVEP